MRIYSVPITDNPKWWMCAMAFHLISLSQTELLPFKYRELVAMLQFIKSEVKIQNESPVMWKQLFCLI